MADPGRKSEDEGEAPKPSDSILNRFFRYFFSRSSNKNYAVKRSQSKKVNPKQDEKGSGVEVSSLPCDYKYSATHVTEKVLNGHLPDGCGYKVDGQTQTTPPVQTQTVDELAQTTCVQTQDTCDKQSQLDTVTSTLKKEKPSAISITEEDKRTKHSTITSLHEDLCSHSNRSSIISIEVPDDPNRSFVKTPVRASEDDAPVPSNREKLSRIGIVHAPTVQSNEMAKALCSEVGTKKLDYGSPQIFEIDDMHESNIRDLKEIHLVMDRAMCEFWGGEEFVDVFMCLRDFIRLHSGLLYVKMKCCEGSLRTKAMHRLPNDFILCENDMDMSEHNAKEPTGDTEIKETPPNLNEIPFIKFHDTYEDDELPFPFEQDIVFRTNGPSETMNINIEIRHKDQNVSAVKEFENNIFTYLHEYRSTLEEQLEDAGLILKDISEGSVKITVELKRESCNTLQDLFKNRKLLLILGHMMRCAKVPSSLHVESVRGLLEVECDISLEEFCSVYHTTVNIKSKFSQVGDGNTITCSSETQVEEKTTPAISFYLGHKNYRTLRFYELKDNTDSSTTVTVTSGDPVHGENLEKIMEDVKDLFHESVDCERISDCSFHLSGSNTSSCLAKELLNVFIEKDICETVMKCITSTNEDPIHVQIDIPQPKAFIFELIQKTREWSFEKYQQSQTNRITSATSSRTNDTGFGSTATLT